MIYLPSSLNVRHPDESRDPDFQRFQLLRVWIPAFAGMTDLNEVLKCP